MGCNCGKNAKKLAGNRVKPQATTPANRSRNVPPTRNTAKTTVIRNGKVVPR